MNNHHQRIIPLAGLAGTAAMAVYMAALLHAQTGVQAGDFTNAAIAEVQDAQGQIVLRGQFTAIDEPDQDDVERKAVLQPVGNDSDAAGEAEVEVSRSTPVQQEIEFSVRNLQAGTSVTFFIDGQAVGQASVDRRGRAELELDVPKAAAAAAR
jgi:hypothetical protein